MLADAFLKLSQLWLLGLCLTWLLWSLALILGMGRRLYRGQRSLEAAARRVETALPGWAAI